MRSPHDRPAPRARIHRHLGRHLVGDRPPSSMGMDWSVRPRRARMRHLLRALTTRPEDTQTRPHPTPVRSPRPRTPPRLRGLRARGRIHRPPTLRRRPRPPGLRPHPRARRPPSRPSPALVRVLNDTQLPRAHRGHLRGGGVAPLERHRTRARARVAGRRARRRLRGVGKPRRDLCRRRAIGRNDTRPTSPADRAARRPGCVPRTGPSPEPALLFRETHAPSSPAWR